MEMVGAIDLCPIATATYRHNFPDAKVVNDRLENIDPIWMKKRIGEIDLLMASPECTNHTCAKGAAPRSEESRATAMQVLRFAKTFEPRWIVMENVVNMKPWARYGELLSDLGELGYNISEQVLNAADFGVAQGRRRLFVICDREAKPAKVLSRTMRTATVKKILDKDGTWKTTPLKKKGRAKDTLARADRAMEALGDGESFLVVYYGTDGCGGWQRIDRPLRTITTVDRFALVTPTKNGHMMRMLQVPELKRAMGLDDDFQLPVGTRRQQIKLLGNGVCAPVMSGIVSSFLA